MGSKWSCNLFFHDTKIQKFRQNKFYGSQTLILHTQPQDKDPSSQGVGAGYHGSLQEPGRSVPFVCSGWEGWREGDRIRVESVRVPSVVPGSGDVRRTSTTTVPRGSPRVSTPIEEFPLWVVWTI